ncbi:hypothetical protein JCM19992_21530 [Thermostilla marina]
MAGGWEGRAGSDREEGEDAEELLGAALLPEVGRVAPSRRSTTRTVCPGEKLRVHCRWTSPHRAVTRYR